MDLVVDVFHQAIVLDVFDGAVQVRIVRVSLQVFSSRQTGVAKSSGSTSKGSYTINQRII